MMNLPKEFAGFEIDEEPLGKTHSQHIAVYHGKLLGQERALKIFSPDRSEDEIFMRQFENEVKCNLTLMERRPKHIVPFHFAGRSPEGNRTYSYVVTTYMAGGSLADMLDSKEKLPVDEALRITIDVLLGLQEAHDAGIIHLDIKPENILFDREGTAYISDFGFSKLSRQGGVSGNSQTSGTGYQGDPRYTPTQLKGKKTFTPKYEHDVDQLGQVLGAMLGVPMPTNDPIRELNPEIDTNLESIMVRTVSSRNHYQSAQDVLDELKLREYSPRIHEHEERVRSILSSNSNSYLGKPALNDLKTAIDEFRIFVSENQLFYPIESIGKEYLERDRLDAEHIRNFTRTLPQVKGDQKKEDEFFSTLDIMKSYVRSASVLQMYFQMIGVTNGNQ